MIVHPNCVRRPIFSRMILPCPSRDNGNGNSGFPSGCRPAARRTEPKVQGKSQKPTYQDVEWLIWPKQCHSLAALPPSSRHTMVACFFGPTEPKTAVFTQTGWSAKWILAESPNDQRHEKDVVPACPAPRQCWLSSTVLCTISTAGLPRQQLRRNQSTLRPRSSPGPKR